MIKRRTDSRERLMKNVAEESFAVDESRLYLDTHPNDKKAMAYFDKHNDARKKAISEYESCYGPITTNDIEATKSGWTWIAPPFPWEEGDN